MRKIVLISVAAALLVPALPALAAPADSSAQPTASAQPAPSRDEAARDPNRQICVNETLSNSRMPRRICHTAREWALLQADDSGN